jgi:SAM-dependent methyltransferase
MLRIRASQKTGCHCRIVEKEDADKSFCASPRGITDHLFWDQKARTYPLPFEQEPLAFTEGVMEIIEERCLPVKGATVLDIGCGTGAFSLPFAVRGATVTALDFSEHMLERLSSEAKRLAIYDVRAVQASWKRINPDAAGLLRSFDIVLSALSIAVETTRDILKMESCARQWCVCIASGRIRYDGLFGEILRAFRAPINPRPDIRQIRQKLEEMGRAFSYESFTVTERQQKSPLQLAEEIARRLEASGKVPNMPRILGTILALFRCREPDCVIEYEVSADMGILLWKADQERSRETDAYEIRTGNNHSRITHPAQTQPLNYPGGGAIY